MKAVRYINPNGETRIGRLDDATITDAVAAGPQGFVPTPEGWTTIENADGRQYDANNVQLLHPTVPNKILAIGETLAHLDLLVARGQAAAETGQDGVMWYRPTAGLAAPGAVA